MVGHSNRKRRGKRGAEIEESADETTSYHCCHCIKQRTSFYWLTSLKNVFTLAGLGHVDVHAKKEDRDPHLLSCGPQQRRQRFHHPFTTSCCPRRPLVKGLPARNCSEIDCCWRRTSRTAAGLRATSHKLPKAVSQGS